MTLSQSLHPPHSLGVYTTLSTLPAADRAQALAKAVREVFHGRRSLACILNTARGLRMRKRNVQIFAYIFSGTIQSINDNKTRGSA